MQKFEEKLFLEMKKTTICHCLGSQNLFLVLAFLCEENYLESTDTNRPEEENRKIAFDTFYKYGLECFQKSFDKFEEKCVKSLVEKSRNTSKYLCKFLDDLKKERKLDCFKMLSIPYYEIKKNKVIEILSSLLIRKLETDSDSDDDTHKIDYKYNNFHEVLFSTSKNILIIGEAGIGKSLLSQYFIYGWAENEWKIIKDSILLRISLKECQPENDFYDEVLK